MRWMSDSQECRGTELALISAGWRCLSTPVPPVLNYMWVLCSWGMNNGHKQQFHSRKTENISLKRMEMMTRVYWYPGLHSFCLQKSALNTRASGISMAGKILVLYLHCLDAGMKKLVKIWEWKVMFLSLVMLSQRKVFDHRTLNFCNLFWIIVPHLRNLDRTSFFIWYLQNCCRWHSCYVTSLWDCKWKTCCIARQWEKM